MREDKNIDRIPTHLPTSQGMFSQEPQRHILMTPHMAAIGGLLAFFSVVLMVVVLPTATYEPPPSDNWAPLSNQAWHGRQIFISNGCVYCHSGFSRPQDVYNAQYYLYPRVSEPGDYYGENQSPNLMGTERTGPDLSQEGGNHPDDWQMAHYWNPRATMPLSIMPRFSFLSQQQLNELIAFNQSQGGKQAMLRTMTLDVGKKLMMGNMGMIADPATAFPDLVQQLKQAGSYKPDGKPSDKSPSGLPWMAVWMVNSFERSYWLTNDPLSVTQENLVRGKQVYLKRCAGCHGVRGDGKGPAAQFLKPTPFDFTDTSMTGIKGPFAGDGFFYHRILTAGPGTAMENFGTRLSVEDIWRVVLFLRTIQNGSLKDQGTVPTVDMYQPWTPPPPLLKYIENHPIPATPTLDKATADPFMSAAQWLAPGMAPDDEIMVGGKLPMTLDRLAGLIRSQYMDNLSMAYDEAKGRGESLPPKDQVMSVDSLEFHAP